MQHKSTRPDGHTLFFCDPITGRMYELLLSELNTAVKREFKPLHILGVIEMHS